MKYIIGIDENGLGPVLGPLVATGVAARCADGSSWLEGIRDSKVFFSAGRKDGFARLEELSLALFFTVYNHLPASPAQFLQRLAAADCPADTPFCRTGLPERFSWASPEQVEEKACHLAGWMKEHGFFITGLASHLTCARRFNELAAGRSKSLVDLLGFVEVIKRLEEPGAEIEAGKIGGLNSYAPWLRQNFPGRDVVPVRETRERSSYVISESNRRWTLSFCLDVEEVSFAACLASIVGKYVRELSMQAINVHFGTTDRVSGYRDPKTKAFIERTLPTLAARGIPENCFLRDK